MVKNWSAPISDIEANRRAGGRRRINKQRQIESFWLGLEVWRLGRQGLLPLEIAAELDIAPVTAYRHYWRYFGKRRAMIAKAKALAERANLLITNNSTNVKD